MQIKSLEDLKALNSTGDEPTDSAITQIVKSMDERAQQRTYRNLAAAVLLRRNIHQETKDLGPVLGDFSGSNNLSTVANWLEREDPDLTEYGEVEIQEYSSQLWSLTDEYMNP